MTSTAAPVGETTPVAPRPPVRMVHLGLGAFHRAHQAWYTHEANLRGDQAWGYQGFTGRSPEAADVLRRQGSRYHLVVRNAHDDRVQTITSIVRATDGADAAALRDVLAAPTTALATLTVTEAGYHLDAAGELDLFSPRVLADLDAVRRGNAQRLQTATGRLVDALAARRRAGGGAIALVSCDNLRANGEVLREGVVGFAREADTDLAQWIEDSVRFVSTMVDRITPAVDARMRASLPASAREHDDAPVVTEPFTEWILAGDFPAGRPPWELAGARFVTDITPFEERKLWLLNAGHSLLAYAGALRGHTLVAEAMTDPVCVDALERLWNDAAAVITLPPEEVRAARADIRERWGNTRIEHSLHQIGADGLHKLRARVAPVILRWRRERRGIPLGELATIGAWVAAVRTGALTDPSAPAQLRAGDVDTAVRYALAAIAPELAGDDAMTSAGVASVRALLP